MVACLEKSDENAEFHQIVDFLSTCSINYALTQIHAIVDGKAVVISESSVRSDLLFNDEDGVTCLTNDEIFENLALMGYEQLSTKLTFQKGNITLLFASMLVQNQAPEGVGSAVHPEPQPTPSTSQPNVSEPQIASLHIETSPTAAPQTAVSQIVFHEAHIDVERAITTIASLNAAQDSDNIIRTQITAMPNVDIHQGMDTGGSPRHQETIGGTPAQTRSERVLAQPNEPPLSKGHTSRSGEGSMEQTFELTNNVLDLEKEKDAQVVEILNLKRRFKKLERKRKSSISYPRRRKYRQVETSFDDGLDEEDASKQGKRSDKLKPMFKDKDFKELDYYMENVEEETVDAAATGVSTVSASVSTAGVTISIAKPRTPPTTTTVFDNKDVTVEKAQTLIKMKEQKAKEKGVDKGNGVLVEKEPAKIKMRDQGDLQVQSDAELAQRLHEEELTELERAQHERKRQEDDTNAALAKEFDEIQARIDVDHELTVRLTHEEQEKYTIEERVRLLAEFFDQRKK
ncbi:hypothetical protein Tco_0266414 [Tanacetum coccineum]